MKNYDYENGCSLSELQADALRCIIDAVDDCKDEDAKAEMISNIPAAMHEVNASAQIEAIIDDDAEEDCEKVCEALGYCPYCPKLDDDDDDDDDFCCEHCPFVDGEDNDEDAEDDSHPEDK